MTYIGGDILEITYDHPTVGQGRFFCKSNEESTINPGGFKTNDDANQVSGDGSMIVQMNRALGSYETPPIAWDMTSENELDKLQQMSNSPLFADWTISHVSGTIWAGNGRVVGDIAGATNAATTTVKIAFQNNGPKRIS